VIQVGYLPWVLSRTMAWARGRLTRFPIAVGSPQALPARDQRPRDLAGLMIVELSLGMHADSVRLELLG
jgi:hypothetical protein